MFKIKVFRMKNMENIRNIAIGLGVMILFPITVHVGTRLIKEEPSWSERDTLEYSVKNRDYEKIQFYSKTIFGLSAIVLGTIIPIAYLGMGFILGGVICLSFGYLGYWNNLNDLVKFVSLILALLILVGSVYYRSMRK